MQNPIFLSSIFLSSKGRPARVGRKARQGEMTTNDQNTIKTHERIRRFLGLWQSSARLSLAKRRRFPERMNHGGGVRIPSMNLSASRSPSTVAAKSSIPLPSHLR